MRNSACFEDIKYISQFIKYADNEHIGKLISDIYDMDFFLNPYNTNMELFLNILLFYNYAIDYGNITLDDLSEEKRNLNTYLYENNIDMFYDVEPEIFYNGVLNSTEHPCKNNLYVNFILTNLNKEEDKIFYNGKKYNHNYKGNITYPDNFDDVEDNFDTLINVYNSIFLPLDKTRRESFIKQITEIVKAISSFKVETDDYKLFFNKAIECIINSQDFYIIDYDTVYCHCIIPLSEKKHYDTIQNKLKLLESENKLYILDEKTNITHEIKHKTSINKQDKHSLIGIKSYNSFEQSFKSLDRAIFELYMKLGEMQKRKNNKKVCPICSPAIDKKERNTKQNHNNTPMCDDCKEIFKEIKKIAPEFTTDDIRGRIKLRSDKERTLSARVLKEKHYEKLNKFLTNLNNKCNTKTMEHLQTLVDKTFQVK